jgi:hypothetical protein
MHLAAKNYAAAATVARRSLELVERTFGPDHISAAQALRILGQTQSRAKRYAEADATLHRALLILQKKGDDNLDYGLALSEYAEHLRVSRRRDEAKKVEVKAKSIFAQSPAAHTVDVSDLIRKK